VYLVWFSGEGYSVYTESNVCLCVAVSTATKERKQSSTVTPKSILDLYDRLEPPSDNFDGQMVCRYLIESICINIIYYILCTV